MRVESGRSVESGPAHPSVRPMLIGVDAGGSKTVACGELHGQQSSGQSGPGNLRSVGLEQACESICQAIDGAIAGLTADTGGSGSIVPMKICIAAAGAGRAQERQQLFREIRRRYENAQVGIVDDASPVLAAVADDSVGVALICGTGSFAWGRNVDGKETRCGGWGYLFGDEGSGYQIGIAALQAAARCADGRGEKTELLQRCCEHFGIAAPEQLIEAVYGRSPSRRELAQLVEVVFDAGPSDAVAAGIIDRAAEEVASLVNAVTRRLDFVGSKGEASLGIAGGVIVGRSVFREQVLRRVEFPFGRVGLVPNPALGAIKLASNL